MYLVFSGHVPLSMVVKKDSLCFYLVSLDGQAHSGSHSKVDMEGLQAGTDRVINRTRINTYRV